MASKNIDGKHRFLTLPTLFSTKQYHKSVNIHVEPIEFVYSGTKLDIQFSQDTEIDQFVVGEKATFGHLEFSGDPNSASIEACLEQLLLHINQNYTSYVIKLPPLFYYGDFEAPLLDAVKKIKFGEVIIDINQSVLVRESETVIDTFASTNRRIYRKLERAGFHVSQSEYLSKEGYILLEENRQNRNVKLSVSYDNLRKQVHILKNKFHFFECRDVEGYLGAYAVTLRLSDDWLYVFYWGEKNSYRKHSPVVYLAAEIMKFCQLNHINRLDAGISSLGGQRDEGLFEFKRRLGFYSCPKITLKGNT